MQELKIPEKTRRHLVDFVRGLRDAYQEGLVSVILYGSAASGEFVDKHSNMNLLAVLKDTDLANLSKASGLLKKFRMFKPLFLTQNYIATSTDIFPIEFLDMRENYQLLYGEDVLKDIHVDIRNLRFQCEQELKSKLIQLRQLYLRMDRDTFALRDLLFKSSNSILHILRNILRLKGKTPPYLKTDILRQVGAELGIDLSSWEKILAAKAKQVKLSHKEIPELFVSFVRDLEKIVGMVDRL